ncbi:MAG: gamma-glutamyltransferase, partial [Pirellulales bacterium]
TCIEYRETAPAAASAKMFAPGESMLTAKAVGVPGTVRGLALAHHRFGRRPWKELVMPAVRLAAVGFAVDRPLADSLNGVLAGKNVPAEFRRIYGPAKNDKWRPGDRMVLPELAATLRLLAEQGPDAFYRGSIARAIVAEMSKQDGLITLVDLAAYEARERKPIHGTFRGYDIYGPPPPSAGGICLVEMLNILETEDLAARGRWSPEVMHLTIEAMRRAYCDRTRYLGDPDFVRIPEHLITKEYAKKLAAEISRDRATKSESLAPDIPLVPEGEQTTHFSIIDRDGMAIANTYTLEQSYGSRIVVRGAGFLLNNEMGDFNRQPGRTDRKGAVGTDANVAAPRKRMLSSQTPTIVARSGKVVLVTGSPGDRTIINTVLGVVLGVLEFREDVNSAVDAPRLHHGWFPDEVFFEGAKDARYAASLAKLRELGHRVSLPPHHQGDAHTIFVGNGSYWGAADGRRRGAAAGY